MRRSFHQCVIRPIIFYTIIFLHLKNGVFAMSGIKETSELLDLLPVLATALEKSLQDGKINVFDAPKFFPVIAAARVCEEKGCT